LSAPLSRLGAREGPTGSYLEIGSMSRMSKITGKSGMGFWVFPLCWALAWGAAGVAFAAEPTWSYDADWADPYPYPFSSVGGSPDVVSFGYEDVTYMQVDTGVSGSGEERSRCWEIEADPNNPTNWNVDPTAGYTVEWRARLDANTRTLPGAAHLTAASSEYFPAIRLTWYLYDWPGALTVTLQDVTGNAGQISHSVGNPTSWHTYRLDVQGGTAKVYVDDYPWPILTKNMSPGTYGDKIMFGDVTGENNGKYQTDYLRTYQSGVLPAPVPPDPNDASHTLFLAHYDGDTGNGGLDADFAVGSAEVVTGDGSIDLVNYKFGTGSLDPNGIVSYQTRDNFNVLAGTVEMWIRPSDWTDGAYQGLLGIWYELGNDIRIQKTHLNQLQASMVGNGKSWTATKDMVNLTDGQWYHIAWTWDLNAQKSELYLDGQPLGATVNVYNRVDLGFDGILNPTMFIGNMQTGSNPFKGQIDEFRISDKDLYGGQAFTPQGAPWQESYCGDPAHPTPVGDLNQDCVVNWADFAIFASHWLECTHPDGC